MFRCLKRIGIVGWAVTAFGLITFLVVSWIGSRLVAPANRSLGPPPPDLPLLEEVIPGGSGNQLAVWRLDKPGSSATVVLLHPLRGDRRNMLTRARLLYGAGYSVVWPDLQAHGESPGEQITFGYLESFDASATVRHARKLYPDSRIGVIGRSLGGAAALLGPGLEIDALVLEAVYPTIEEAVNNRLRMRLGDARPLFSPLLTWQLDSRLGVSPGALRPIDRIGSLGHAVMVISGERDKHTTAAQTRRLFEAASEPKELVLVPGAGHEDLLFHDTELYRKRVLGFFEKHLR